MELIKLGNGVRVVEIEAAELAEYREILGVAIHTQLGVTVDNDSEIRTEAGRYRYAVVEA
jgi:hypothetical protein